MPARVIVAENRDAFFARAAEIFAESAPPAPRIFRVALSGGSTPKTLFEILSTEPHRSRIPWERTEIYWGDERCVPPDHPDSNFRMANEKLLTRVPVPSRNVHRMKGEMNPAAAAEIYEAQLRKDFPDGRAAFDLVLLGMGNDGHTASLFPGTLALTIEDRWVVGNKVPQMRTDRLTLTFPAINGARRVLFLAAGAEKAAVIREAIEAPRGRFPCERVKPVDGELVWLLDAEAASNLSETSRKGVSS